MSKPESATVRWLRKILKDVEQASGYPYPEGAVVEDGKAFAYGLAIGTLHALMREWERDDPSL